VQRRQLGPEEQVRDHVEVLAQGEVLEHRGDAQRDGRTGSTDRDLLVVEDDLSAVRAVHPGQDLDQG